MFLSIALTAKYAIIDAHIMFTIVRKRPVHHKLISLVTASFFFLNVFTTDVLALAPELRSKPFSDATKIEFQQAYEMMCAAGRLKGLIESGNARPGNIVRLNNEHFPGGEVEIEKDIRQGKLKCSNRVYDYAVFHFKKDNRTIEARYFKDYDKLTADELKELGVKTDEDKSHFFDSTEHPALRDVWFVKPTDEAPAAEKNYIIPYTADWSSIFDDNSKPLKVEVGFADDEGLIKMAQTHPECNFIGIEVQEQFVFLMNSRLKKRGQHISNLKLVAISDINAFAEQKFTDLISEVYYIAYNPRPAADISGTKRSALKDEKSFKILVKLLKSGGRIYISTDSELPETVALASKYGLSDVSKDHESSHRSGHYPEVEKVKYIIEKPVPPTAAAAPTAPAANAPRQSAADEPEKKTLSESNKDLPSYTEETLKALEVSRGNESKAARALGMTQSGISRRVRTIEKIATENNDLITLERLHKILPFSFFAEETLSAMEKAQGHQTNAARILGIGQQAISRRIKAIRRIAIKNNDTIILERLNKVLSLLPVFTEETLKALETVRGNQLEAAGILGIDQSTISYRIQAIRKAAVEKNDTTTLERLNKALSPLPDYTEDTLNALENSNGNQPKAATALGISQRAVSHRLYAIRNAAIVRADTATLERLNRVSPYLPPYIGKQSIEAAMQHIPNPEDSRQSAAGEPEKESPPAADAQLSVQAEADRIHSENLKLTRTIEDKTMICHIVTDSILPDMQLKEGVLNRLEVKMRDPKYGEKVVALSVKDPNNAEEFMAKLSELKRQIESDYQGYRVQFDVACPKKEFVEGIQKLGMQALAFDREGEGEIIQIEGIILALRALRTGSIASLISAYKTITGKDYTTDKTDINELAKILLFTLPVRRIDVNQIGTLNRIIEESIKKAA